MGTYQTEDRIDQLFEKQIAILDEMAARIEAIGQHRQRRKREVKLLFPFSLLAAAIDIGFKRLEQGARWFVQRVIGPWIDRLRKG